MIAALLLAAPLANPRSWSSSRSSRATGSASFRSRARPTLTCPPTFDHDTLRQSLATVDPEFVPGPGSDLANVVRAVRKAIDAETNHRNHSKIRSSRSRRPAKTRGIRSKRPATEIRSRTRNRSSSRTSSRPATNHRNLKIDSRPATVPSSRGTTRARSPEATNRSRRASPTRESRGAASIQAARRSPKARPTPGEPRDAAAPGERETREAGRMTAEQARQLWLGRALAEIARMGKKR